jgi:hypothetical protein
MQSTPLRTDRRPAEQRGLNHRLRRLWLPRLLWFWVGGAILVAACLALAGPLTPFTGLEAEYLALAVVPFLMLMLASGLAWLVVLVNSPPRRRCSAGPSPRGRQDR